MKTNKKIRQFTPPHLRNINYLVLALSVGTASLTSCYDDNNISPLWAW